MPAQRDEDLRSESGGGGKMDWEVEEQKYGAANFEEQRGLVPVVRPPMEASRPASISPDFLEMSSSPGKKTATFSNIETHSDMNGGGRGDNIKSNYSPTLTNLSIALDETSRNQASSACRAWENTSRSSSSARGKTFLTRPQSSGSVSTASHTLEDSLSSSIASFSILTYQPNFVKVPPKCPPKQSPDFTGLLSMSAAARKEWIRPASGPSSSHFIKEKDKNKDIVVVHLDSSAGARASELTSNAQIPSASVRWNMNDYNYPDQQQQQQSQNKQFFSRTRSILKQQPSASMHSNQTWAKKPLMAPPNK